MDRREMICQTASELLCATCTVMANAPIEAIARLWGELARRYGLLGSYYLGELAERLMDYQHALRSGGKEQANSAWRELIHTAAAASNVLPCGGSIGEIAARLIDEIEWGMED